MSGKRLFSLLVTVFLCAVHTLYAQSFLPAIETEAAKKNFSAAFTVTPMDKAVTIKKNVVILAPEAEGTEYTLSGYFNGQVISKTKNTIIKLKNVYLENTKGNAALYGEAKFELSAVSGTTNYIVSSGKTKEKNGAVQCRKDIVLGGSGTVYIIGTAYHGMKGDDIKIKGSGTHYLQGSKEGAALNCDTLTVEKEKSFKAYFLSSKNGIKADNEITIASGSFYLYNNEVALKTDKNKDAPAKPHAITLTGGTFYVAGNESLYSTEKGAWKTAGAKIVEE